MRHDSTSSGADSNETVHVTDSPDDPSTLGSNRPTLYTALVVVAMLGMFVYQLRTAGIFACAATDVEDAYLAYCNSSEYGDYDHGAVWFGLEPDVRRLAAAADVLFLGTSRVQFGFSAAATDDWFAARGISYYLLGFSHSENVTFTAPLLASVRPRARAYVINTDRFFEGEETSPAAEILHAQDAQSRYRRKRVWQQVHHALCGTAPILCGDTVAFVRSRSTGRWTVQNTDELTPSGVAEAAEANADVWAERVARARAFVASLPVEPHCVFLTVVPWAETPRAEAAAIARAVGVDLIAPQLDDLRTFDGSHLDAPSAEQWAKQFFELAGARIESCSVAAKGGAVHDFSSTGTPTLPPR